MAKKILIGLIVIIVAFLGYVASKPSDFKISREISINAPAEKVFPYANNVKLMNAWNPWMKLDPQVKTSYSGPEEGIGAATSWDGDKNIGAGTATIVESNPNTLVRVQLDYKKPFASTSTAEFVLRTEGAQTIVTWSNAGHAPFVAKIFCTLMGGMDKMVGGTFEKGLVDLKAMVESPH